MTTTSIQTLATEARSFMVSKTRDDGSKFWSRSDDAPQWVHDLCFAAHDAGDMLPDDHRYAFIVEALDALSDTEDADDVDLEADIYTHELCAWLSSRVDRSGYCDSAMDEFGITEYKSLVEHLQIGQAYEKAEVLGSVRWSLETRAEETEDSDEPRTYEPGDSVVAAMHGEWVKGEYRATLTDETALPAMDRPHLVYVDGETLRFKDSEVDYPDDNGN
jgi:hypothetical protein